MKKVMLAAALILGVVGTASADSVTVPWTTSANTLTQITQTKAYVVTTTAATCPALPWTGAITQTYTGAAVSGSLTIPNAIVGQRVCLALTYLAGTNEGGFGNVPSDTITLPAPTGTTIIGPLVVK